MPVCGMPKEGARRVTRRVRCCFVPMMMMLQGWGCLPGLTLPLLGITFLFILFSGQAAGWVCFVSIARVFAKQPLFFSHENSPPGQHHRRRPPDATTSSSHRAGERFKGPIWCLPSGESVLICMLIGLNRYWPMYMYE